MLDMLLAAALAQATNQAGPAPDWRQIARVEGRGTVYFDPASLARDGRRLQITLRAAFDADQPSGMRTGISVVRIDCTAQTVALGRIISFDARGTVLSDGQAQGAPSVPHTVAPDSPYRAVIDHFCAPGA